MPSDPTCDRDLESARFDFEPFIKSALNIDGDRRIPPDICKPFLRGTCTRGTQCPYRHGRPGERRTIVVCKHWLRSLCKKGDACEFLHEMNASRMPTCYFWTKFGECVSGDTCVYLHPDPDKIRSVCPWYTRGYCKHGPTCRYRHERRQLCPLYLAGFCPKGPECTDGHAKFEIPDLDKLDIPPFPYGRDAGGGDRRTPGFVGSAANAARGEFQGGGGGERGFRPLSEVDCFKCGQKGHYANRCTGAPGGGRY